MGGRLAVVCRWVAGWQWCALPSLLYHGYKSSAMGFLGSV